MEQELRFVLDLGRFGKKACAQKIKVVFVSTRKTQIFKDLDNVVK